MVFGTSKKYFSFLFRPYLILDYYKRHKLLSKYKKNQLCIGLNTKLDNVEIGKFVFLGNKITLRNSTIGDHSYINSDTHISNSKIGKFCSIASNVTFGLGMHPTHLISTHPSFYSCNKGYKTFADREYFLEYGTIILGNDVWVGNNAIIMYGVSIGDGAIIAAGAIVTKDVKPYEVVGGIPAKHIKFRFKEDEILKLSTFKWWNKDEAWLEEHYKLFLDREKFLEYLEKNE